MKPVLLIAKVKGYPWWPARQEDPMKHGIMENKDKSTFVYFYGTQNVGWASSQQALPFFQNLHLLAGHGKGKQHKLNTALQDIEDSLSDARDTNQFQAALPRDASGSYLIPHADKGSASSSNAHLERKRAHAASVDLPPASISSSNKKDKKDQAHVGTEDTQGKRDSRDDVRVNDVAVANSQQGVGGAAKHQVDVKSAVHRSPSNSEALTKSCSAAPNADMPQGLASGIAQVEQSDMGQLSSSAGCGMQNEVHGEGLPKALGRSDTVWNGECVEVKKNGNRHYSGFIKHGQTFGKYDCAFLKSDAGQEPYIVRIHDMWEDVLGQKMFLGYWFYRPSEIKRPSKDMHSSELVLSDWGDDNPVESVMSKANVLFVKGILPKSAMTEQKGGFKLKGGASIKLEGEGLKLEGCFFHHVCSRHLIVKTSKISVLSDKRVVQLLGQGLAMALTFAHSMPITENAVAGGSSGVAGRVAGGSGACAPGESLANDQKAVMRAAAGLTELRAGAQGMRAEGWVPCTQRWSGWDGIKLINRSNRLILEQDSLTLSMRPAETGRVTAMALSADALLLAAVCQGGALSVWDTSTKQIVKQFTEHKGGNNKYEFLSVAFTHHGARVVVGGAVRQRHKLVPGVDENVQKLVGGFIREFDICSNPAVSSSGASCSIIQTVAVSTGCITSMLPAWSLASPTKLPATSHAAAQQADASQGDGSGVVLARCVEEGKIYCFQFDPAAGKLVLAASIQVSGAGSLAVVYPRAVGQSLPSADCSATEATQGVTETAQPDCVHAIKPDRMQADLKVGSVAEDSRPHVLVACSERGLAFFDLASHEELVGGAYDLIYAGRCHDMALVPACTPKDKPSHMTWILSSGEEWRGGNAVVKLHSASWPEHSRKLLVQELREFKLQGSSPAIALSLYSGCVASNGRYALRAVDQQLYVWNLDTRQLTAIIQHEAGKEFSNMLLHPLHPTLFMGTVSGQVEYYTQTCDSTPGMAGDLKKQAVRMQTK